MCYELKLILFEDIVLCKGVFDTTLASLELSKPKANLKINKLTSLTTLYIAKFLLQIDSVCVCILTYLNRKLNICQEPFCPTQVVSGNLRKVTGFWLVRIIFIQMLKTVIKD